MGEAMELAFERDGWKVSSINQRSTGVQRDVEERKRVAWFGGDAHGWNANSRAEGEQARLGRRGRGHVVRSVSSGEV